MKNITPLRIFAITIITGFLTFTNGPPAVAQVDVSFSAGPNVTSMDVQLEDLRAVDEGFATLDYDPVVGFYLGFSSGVSFGSFSLRGGFTFVNGGAIFNGSEFLDDDEFRVNFITLPVDLRLYVPVSQQVRPYLSAGPEFRYRLKIDEGDPAFVENLRRLTPTASIGAGVRIELPGRGVGISPEIRYGIDFVGLVRGEVTVGEEAVRIGEAFRADMYRIGIGVDV